MSKTVSAEYLSSMRAQFPDLDADAAAAWIATLQDVDNPETMLASVLAKGKFPRRASAYSRGKGGNEEHGPRGTINQSGGWDRHAHEQSHWERLAWGDARHCAEMGFTPEQAFAYLTTLEDRAHWYHGNYRWTQGWFAENWSNGNWCNTASACIVQACLRAKLIAPAQRSAPTQEVEARLLRDWTQARA